MEPHPTIHFHVIMKLHAMLLLLSYYNYIIDCVTYVEKKLHGNEK